MVSEVVIQNIQDKVEVTKEIENIIEKAVELCLLHEEMREPLEVSILLVDNDKIREINNEQRGIDSPTDVLSFPIVEMKDGKIKSDLGDIDMEEDLIILGDIVISLEMAYNQAVEYGHSFERELAFLTTHGTFHLLGYDHQDEESENIMISKQKVVLDDMGLKRKGEKEKENTGLDYKILVKKAIDEKSKAYAPYSGFKVGAAVLTESGNIYTGVNIENISFGATNCAERTAIFKAISNGERKIKAIAISSDSEKITFPCGICRQVIFEFGDKDTSIVCSNNDGEFKVYTIEELLPYAFESIKQWEEPGGKLNMRFKSGFVSIVGRPNVGKSTLINQIVGEKISIISDKYQTTRNMIKAIVTKENSQIVFIDTPGIIRPKNKLGEYMMKVALDSLDGVDLILFMTEGTGSGPGTGDLEIIEQLKKIKVPIFLVLNKIDLVRKENLLTLISSYKQYINFKNIIPISAISGDGIDILLKEIVKILPEGPKYFPDDMVTDQPEKLIAAEIIREKFLILLEQEIPHGIGVEITSFKEREGKKLLDIETNVYCEKESHKGIVIGKDGAMLKKVGALARNELENIFGIKIFLHLWVKVKKDWRNKDPVLKVLGYK